MSIESLMNHFAHIQRRNPNISEAKDPFVDKALSVKCRASSPAGSRPAMTFPKGQFVVTHIVFFPPDVDIDEDDIILWIRDAQGSVVASSLEIGLVSRISDGTGLVHHLQAQCWETRLPAEVFDGV